MSNFVFSRPLGDVSSPFGFSACMDDPYNTATIVAGIQGLSNTINNDKQANIQREFEADESELAYLRQRELMNDQFAYAERMWQQNNEYNTPKAQMQRLKDAGLNPYLYAHGSDIGTGNSSAPASSPSAPGVSKASAPGWNNPNVSDFGSLLMQASSLKNDKMRSFADLVNAYPKILEACNGDTSKAESIIRNLAGVSGLNGDLPFKLATSQYESQEANREIAQVQAFLSKKYGDRNASNMIAQSEALINESFARVRKMASDAKVNEATIDKLASDVVRNVADAWKLKKEGEKYVADAATINGLRKYIISQARSQSNMMDLRSFLSGAEPDTPLNDFFTSGEYQKGIMETKQIDQAASSSLLIRAMDKAFGEYLKVSAGGSTNFSYPNGY